MENIIPNLIIPNIEWYTELSKVREVQPLCPFASVEICPRYFQSLSLLGCAGSTSIGDVEEKRLIDYWNKSDLWPKTGEYETSVTGPKDNPRTFTGPSRIFVLKQPMIDSDILLPFSLDTQMK